MVVKNISTGDVLNEAPGVRTQLLNTFSSGITWRGGTNTWKHLPYQAHTCVHRMKSVMQLESLTLILLCKSSIPWCRYVSLSVGPTLGLTYLIEVCYLALHTETTSPGENYSRQQAYRSPTTLYLQSLLNTLWCPVSAIPATLGDSTAHPINSVMTGVSAKKK